MTIYGNPNGDDGNEPAGETNAGVQMEEILTEQQTAEAPKDKGNIKGKLQSFLSFLIVCLIIAGAGMAIGYNLKKEAVSIKHYPAGLYSASLTEKSELLFLCRNTGETILVDSTLTKVISNEMASQEYLKTNRVSLVKQ